MQRSLPKYRINYRHCKENNHQSEKTNLVCLEKSCLEQSLICSFCIEEKHRGHSTKPLKHFLQNLQKHYADSPKTDLDKELQDIQYAKDTLMEKIQKAVETLSTGFQQLQEEVIKQYENIKSQIIDKESNKNRFKQFYHTMAVERKGDPNFEIQNYLNFESLFSFNLSNDVDDLATQTLKKIEEIKRNLVAKQKVDFSLLKSQPLVKITDIPQEMFVIPWSIEHKGDLFSQKYLTSKETICFLSKLLKDWQGKMRIKVINLEKMAELTIGVAKEKDIRACKHHFTFKFIQGAYHLNSKGQTRGNSVNYIKSIKTGDVIDVILKKNKLKISSKGDICNFDLTNKHESMFFFNLQGICQIQVIYPFKKEQ